jgi:hypothetical protein
MPEWTKVPILDLAKGFGFRGTHKILPALEALYPETGKGSLMSPGIVNER